MDRPDETNEPDEWHEPDEPDEQDDPLPATWTTAYRKPIAVVSGLLGGLCCWLLFTGAPAVMWIGGGGLVVLIAWVCVFRTLYRRGY